MLIRHGKLLDVIGRPAKFGGFTIVPAVVELDGRMFQPSFHLGELPADRIPPVLRVPVQQLFDAAWVYARLPHAFGLTPTPSEGEKELLYQGFVAVRDAAGEGIPFELSDYYGRSSITFSQAETDQHLKQEIADTFWGVLLVQPDELADFDVRFFHIGAGVWLHYGCDSGEPYCSEETEDNDE